MDEALLKDLDLVDACHVMHSYSSCIRGALHYDARWGHTIQAHQSEDRPHGQPWTTGTLGQIQG